MAREIKRIAMLSTHGYFDPIPVLGRTDTGGQVVYVLELAKALSSVGTKVDIYTRWFDQDKPQKEPVPNYPDVNVIRIKAGPWEFIPKERIYDLLPELSENMIEYIQKNCLDYDLFHGHYIDAGIVALNVAERLQKPSFFTAHSIGAWKKDQMGGNEIEMEEKFNFKLRIAEELRVFKNVNAQSVTSIVQLEKINELYNYFAENIEIIPPGVDVHHFKPLHPNENPIPVNLPKKYIYCISRIDTNKGHDFLLRAFDIVRKKLKDVDLVIGGGSPNPKAREKGVFKMMHDIIDESGMQDRVHILGYVPDEMMAPYYRHAQLFVLPSLFEPFGMTTQEAMACGTPVVASKYGGIRNFIRNRVDGMLVDPSDAEEFAGVLIEILSNDDLRQSLGREGYDTVQREFSWEAIAEKFVSFYQGYL